MAWRSTVGHRFVADESDTFLSTNILLVDADAGDPNAITKELEQYAVAIHSTYKHSSTAPRCRIAFLLAYPTQGCPGEASA